MAIIELTPDFPGLTTTDRLLESIHNHPEGLTVGQLADRLNRPISMLQICLKILIANRKVAIRHQNNGHQLAKVYIIQPDKLQSLRQLRRTASNSDGVTPIGLRAGAGLTKIQLATQLGLSVRTINDWEQKRSQPKLVPSQLKQMMSVYQCTLDELIAAFE